MSSWTYSTYPTTYIQYLHTVMLDIQYLPKQFTVFTQCHIRYTVFTQTIYIQYLYSVILDIQFLHSFILDIQYLPKLFTYSIYIVSF